MLAGGLYFLLSNGWLYFTGETVEGRVVAKLQSSASDLERQEQRERGVTDVERGHHYQIEFTASDQRQYRIESPGMLGDSIQVGDAVTLVYPRAEPAAAKADRFLVIWGQPLLLMFMGAVFWLLGVFVEMMI